MERLFGSGQLPGQVWVPGGTDVDRGASGIMVDRQTASESFHEWGNGYVLSDLSFSFR